MKRHNHFFAPLILSILILFCTAYILTFREIPILMYHFVGTEVEAQSDPLVVSEKTFEDHVARLKKWGYRVYSLDELYELKTSKHFFFQKGVVLTFDDGNISFLKRAVPILQKYNVPAASFLVWNSMLNKENGSMSVEEAQTLSQQRLVTLGAHTENHLELIGLSDSILRKEIADCRQNLEKAIGKNIWYFAYPGGHFDEQTLSMVKKAGYRMAFTTSRKHLKDRRENLYALTRVKITEKDANSMLFWYKVSGFYSLFKQVKYVI